MHLNLKDKYDWKCELLIKMFHLIIHYALKVLHASLLLGPCNFYEKHSNPFTSRWQVDKIMSEKYGEPKL